MGRRRRRRRRQSPGPAEPPAHEPSAGAAPVARFRAAIAPPAATAPPAAATPAPSPPFFPLMSTAPWTFAQPPHHRRTLASTRPLRRQRNHASCKQHRNTTQTTQEHNTHTAQAKRGILTNSSISVGSLRMACGRLFGPEGGAPNCQPSPPWLL